MSDTSFFKKLTNFFKGVSIENNEYSNDINKENSIIEVKSDNINNKSIETNVSESQENIKIKFNENSNNIFTNEYFSDKKEIILFSILNYDKKVIEASFIVNDNINLLELLEYIYKVFSDKSISTLNKKIISNFVVNEIEEYSEINIKIDTANIFSIYKENYIFLIVTENMNKLVTIKLIEELIKDFSKKNNE